MENYGTKKECFCIPKFGVASGTTKAFYEISLSLFCIFIIKKSILVIFALSLYSYYFFLTLKTYTRWSPTFKIFWNDFKKGKEKTIESKTQRHFYFLTFKERILKIYSIIRREFFFLTIKTMTMNTIIISVYYGEAPHTKLQSQEL